MTSLHFPCCPGKLMCHSGSSSGCLANLLSVLYKSDNLMVVSKPFDVKINSDDLTDSTVATQLSRAYPTLVDDHVAHGFRFVHRLDYATSGCLCIALTKKAARVVSKAFAENSVTKHYLALVRGHVLETSGNHVTIDVPIGNEEEGSVIGDLPPNRMCTVESPSCTKPRAAKTTFVLLEHGSYDNQQSSKVLLIPHTGRRHQLRVHCASLGHCIVGDYTYSHRADKDPYRMMLHSYRLRVTAGSELIDVRASPDPFTTSIDSRWQTSRVFETYENYCTSLPDGQFIDA